MKLINNTTERFVCGSEFEVRPRNQLTRQAIARECASWIRRKATFRTNDATGTMQGVAVVDAAKINAGQTRREFSPITEVRTI